MLEISKINQLVFKITLKNKVCALDIYMMSDELLGLILKKPKTFNTINIILINYLRYKYLDSSFELKFYYINC